MIITLWTLFFFFALIGIPVAFVMGLSSLFTLLLQSDIPLIVMAQRMFGGLDRFVFLAVPFFIIAGTIMTESGITWELINFSNALVGHLRGGLAHVNIVASMLFGGIQGSGNADTAAIGSILIPAMIDEGYKKGYSCAVTAASSCLAPIIPPSMMMIVYGAIAEVSVARMFAAGFIPGFIMAISMMSYSYIYSIRNGPERKGQFLISNVLKCFKTAIWSLMLPVIIMGGILSGIFTATEAGVVAAVYSIFVGLVIHRKLKLSRLKEALINAGALTAMAGMLLAMASVFNWILVYKEVPVRTAELILSISTDRNVIMLMVIVFLYIVGMFMDVMASMVILVPILAPLGIQLGYDEIHWGLVVVMSLAMGGITPPVGINLFLATGIARCKYSETAKAVLPFDLFLALVIFLIAYVPDIPLLIPRLFLD
jgi:tripartite ATP-independent transporter DctM subunit